MYKVKLSALFICLATVLFAQKPVNDTIDIKKLCREWKLVSHNFPDSTITLTTVKKEDAKLVYHTYEFKSNGELAYQEHAPEVIYRCGLGMPYLDESLWIRSGQYVRIKQTGGVMKGEKYKYDLLYKVELSADKLILTKVKTYTNKHCDPCVE